MIFVIFFVEKKSLTINDKKKFRCLIFFFLKSFAFSWILNLKAWLVMFTKSLNWWINVKKKQIALFNVFFWFYLLTFLAKNRKERKNLEFTFMFFALLICYSFTYIHLWPYLYVFYIINAFYLSFWLVCEIKKRENFRWIFFSFFSLAF